MNGRFLESLFPFVTFASLELKLPVFHYFDFNNYKWIKVIWCLHIYIYIYIYIDIYIFQEYEEPVYSYSTHLVRRSPRDIHNILELSPPFASSEGVGSDRYQSDSAHRTQPTP